MADDVLTRDGPVSVPMDYLVPQGGELVPLMVVATMDGTSAAGPFFAAVQVIAPSGRVMGSAISDAIAAGASASVTWFPGAELAEASSGSTFTTETISLDTRQASVSSVGVLQTNAAYTVSVQGTMSDWNLALTNGSPEADALFPTSGGAARLSTQVGIDPDTLFAYPTSHPQVIGHWTQFEMNLGAGWSHVEPTGGPFTTPQTNHVYTYTVVGQGSPIQFRINDSPRTDNYGIYKIVVFSGAPGGGSGSSGTVTAVTSTNTAIAVVNGTTTPALTLATLDVIATDGPPAADWSNNAKKITGVKDPTLSQDAATKAYVDGIVIPGGASNVQVFAAGAGQTWNKPAGAKVVDVICIGSGGQGGGGTSGTGAASNSAGSGGGGGAVTRAVLQASDVSTPQTVNVAAGGTGSGGPGANGADGGLTTFGSLLLAGGGGGGIGGVAGTSHTGGAGGSTEASATTSTSPTFSGGPGVSGQGATVNTSGSQGRAAEWGGASGGGATNGGTGKNGGPAIFGGPAGGAGGGATSAASFAAGAGGGTQSYAAVGGGGAAAGTSGATPTKGGDGTFTGPYCGQGGGGGGCGNSGVAGKNGGVGGVGAGGGGGGSSVNGTAGSGGAGGPGRCIVISW